MTLPDGSTVPNYHKIGSHTFLEGVRSATQNGASGDGEEDARAPLNTLANETLQPGGGVIFFGSPNTFLISANMDFPANVTLMFAPGAKLRVTEGVTVGIHGQVLATPTEIIFTGAGTVTCAPNPSSNFWRWWDTGTLGYKSNSGNFINVMEFGAIGSGNVDDSPAVNRAATYLRSLTYSIPGAQQRSNPGVLYFPAGYTFRLETSINLQLIDAWGWGIYAKGAIIIGSTAGFPVFDCLGSAFGAFEDVYIVGDQDQKPWTGILTGRLTMDAQQAGSHLFKNLKIDGYFTQSGAFATGEGNCWLNPVIHNLEHNAYQFAIDGLHHIPISTAYTPCAWPADTADSCIQHEIINCDFNGSTIGPAIFFSNINQLRISGYATSSDSAAILYLEGAGLNTIRNLEIDVHVETTPTCNIRFESIASTSVSVEGLNLRDGQSGATVALIQQGTNVTSLNIVSGDLFKGSGVTVPFMDGTVTLGSNVRLNYGYPKFSPYTILQLLDDHADSFIMPGSLPSAVLLVASDGAGTESAMVWARANGAPATQDIGSARGTNVEITTGPLSGTTGTDGKVTISAANNGRIYIENRIGGTRTFSIMPVGY